MAGNCLRSSVIYQATVTTEDSKPDETYVGLTETSFKTKLVEHSTQRLLWNRQGLNTQPKIYPYHLRRSTNASLLKRPSIFANAWDGSPFSFLTITRKAVAKKHLDSPLESHFHKYMWCLILRKGFLAWSRTSNSVRWNVNFRESFLLTLKTTSWNRTNL